MPKDQRPFDQLSEQDQKNAIDVGIAVTLLLNRVSTIGPPLDAYVTKEFANASSLPPNVVKYALRELGQLLIREDWTYKITKEGQNIVTEFKTNKYGDNGEKDG